MMNKKTTLPDIWLTLAHKVLATVLVDHGAVFPVMEVLAHDVRLFPAKEAHIWRAVVECIEANTPPTVEAVAIRANGIEPGYIQTISNLWNDDDNRRVVYHAEELKQIGMLAQVRGIARQLAEVEDPDQLTEAIVEAETSLAGVLAAQMNRSGDALSVSQAAWEEVEQFNGGEIPTGLKWFDKLTGGTWPSFNYWIAGAYKSGKSTLMRNLVLNTCASGIPVDVFAAEGSRETFALDCQAMIATGLLIDQDQPPADLYLSGLFIKRAWRKQYKMKAEIIEAIKRARQIWETYPVRVWDSRDGIKDLATLRYRVKHGKMSFGSKVFFGDYSQLFGSSGTLFERQMAIVHLVQDVASSENVAFWMLTQRNEEAIRGGGGYSAGVKGGGDAAAAADFLLMPSINADTPMELTVKLKHSRHTGIGEYSHLINSSSGLITDSWIRETKPDYWTETMEV
jgi:hypothetical protein